jgi:hypothetical protein
MQSLNNEEIDLVSGGATAAYNVGYTLGEWARAARDFISDSIPKGEARPYDMMFH